MRCLDLFSGAGGASMGYAQAGYEVLGVDHVFQPRYPFPFVQADALKYLAGVKPGEFDLIHASPPCQAYSTTRTLHGNAHPALFPATREALQRIGTPYVIENVVGAPTEHHIVLCGEMFGLKVIRHRLFETSHLLFQPPHSKHKGRTGSHRWPYVGDYLQVTGNGGNYRLDEGKAAMGIDWMESKLELSQAIPPAYTRWIGEQMAAYLY